MAKKNNKKRDDTLFLTKEQYAANHQAAKDIDKANEIRKLYAETADRDMAIQRAYNEGRPISNDFATQTRGQQDRLHKLVSENGDLIKSSFGNDAYNALKKDSQIMQDSVYRKYYADYMNTSDYQRDSYDNKQKYLTEQENEAKKSKWGSVFGGMLNAAASASASQYPTKTNQAIAQGFNENTEKAAEAAKEASQRQQVYNQYKTDLFNEEYTKKNLATINSDKKLAALIEGAYREKVTIDSLEKDRQIGINTYENDPYYAATYKAYNSYIEKINSLGYDANSLLDSYTREQNRISAAEQEKAISEFADKNAGTAALASLAYVAANPLQINAVPEILSQGIGNAINGEYKPLDTNSAAFAPTRFRETVSKTVSENIQQEVKNKTNSEFWTHAASFAYQTGLSMGDFLSLSVLPEPVSLAIMGTSAGVAATKDATDRGVSADQALVYGIFAGTAEAFFERFSLEKLNALKATDKTGVLNYVKNILKQQFTEGSEEVFTDIANAISDQIINGNASELAQQYQALVQKYNGDTDRAWKELAKNFGLQLAESYAGGALSGGIIGMYGGAVGNYRLSSVGKSVASNTDELNSLINIASGMPSDSRSAKLVSQINSSTNVTNAKIGELYVNTLNEVTESFNKAGTIGELTNEFAAVSENAGDYNGSLLTEFARSYQENAKRIVETEQRSEKKAARVNAKTNANIADTNTNAAAESDGAITTAQNGGKAEVITATADTKKNTFAVPVTIDSTGNSTVITSVHSTKGGDIRFTTASGETVSVNDITAKNQHMANIVNDAVLETKNNVALGVNGASLYIKKALDANLSSKDYVAFRDYSKQAYLLGVGGANWATVTKQATGVIDRLGATTARQFYDAGVADSKALTEIRESNKQKRKKTVQKSTGGKYENKTDNTELDAFLQRAAEKTHIDIVYNVGNDNNTGGEFKAGEGRAFINEDTNTRGDLTSYFHEGVGEALLAFNPADYRLISDSIIDYLEDQNVITTNNDIRAYAEGYHEKQTNTTIRDAKNELTNDCIAALFTSEEGFKQYCEWLATDKNTTVNEKKTIIEKLKDLFNSLIEKFKDFVNKEKYSASEQSIAEMEIKKADELRKQILSAMDTMIENLENGTEVEIGNKNSININNAITVDMDEEDRAKVLKNTKIKLTDDTVSSKDINVNDYDDIKSRIEKPLRAKLDKLGVFKKYKSNAINIDFEFTHGGFSKSIHSQKEYGGSNADFASVAANLDMLLDNAVLIETHTDKGKGTPKENARLKQVYVFMSALNKNNSIIPVQFEIMEYIDNNNRLYLAVAMTKINEADVVGNTARINERTNLLPTSNISIVNIFKKINPQDKNFLKYIPDEFLNAEQKEAKASALDIEAEKYGKKDNADSNLSVNVNTDAYSKAIEQGDEATAQKLVDEAAENWGAFTADISDFTPLKFYHGTQSFGFTEFNLDFMDDKRSIFLTSDIDTASTYSGVDNVRKISERNTLNIDKLSDEEVAERLNQISNEEGTRKKYYKVTPEYIESLKPEFEEQKDRLRSYLRWYDRYGVNTYGEDRLFNAIQRHLDAEDWRELASSLYSVLQQTSPLHDSNVDVFKLRTLSILEDMRDRYDVSIEGGTFVEENAVGTLRPYSSKDLHNWLKEKVGKGNYQVYARLDNPLIVDVHGRNWNDIGYLGENWRDSNGKSSDNIKEYRTTRQVVRYAYEKGYDGVIFKNIMDNGGRNGKKLYKPADFIAVVFVPENVKSADAVTYDEEGKVIPLEERFNEESKDIRYSVNIDTNAYKSKLDSEYMRLVKDPEKNRDRLQKMVYAAARAAGYTENSDYQGTSAFNGSAPADEGWYENEAERLEAARNGEYEGDWTLDLELGNDIDMAALKDRISARMYNRGNIFEKESIQALRNVMFGAKKITMYRSVPSSVKETRFRNGDWITPSREYAKDNAAIHGWGDDYRIIKQTVSIKDVWWDGNDINEFGFDDGKNYTYKNTENNIKSLDVVTYDDNGNVIPLSERFNEEAEDVRYSVNIDTDKSSLIKENKQLQKSLDYYKMMSKRNTGHKVSRSEIRRIAADLKTSWRSTMSVDEIAEELTALYDHISSGEATWGTIELMGKTLGKELVESAKSELDPETQEVRDYLKNVEISLDEYQEAEVRYAFENMRTWLNSVRKGVKYRKDGIGLDSAWREMSSLYPYIFDPDTNANEQPIALYEAIQGLYDTVDNSYGYDENELAEMIMLDIYDKYYDIPEVVTPVDRANKKLMQERADSRRRLEEVKTADKERYEKKTAEIQEKYDKKLDRKQAKIAKLEADIRYRIDRNKERSENRRKSALRERILKDTNTLSKWIAKPNKENSVPTELQKPLFDFLTAINFNNQDGVMTKRWQDVFFRLHGAFSAINADDSSAADTAIKFPQGVTNVLYNLAEEYDDENISIYEMSLQDLSVLKDTVAMIKSTITQSHKLLANERTESLDALGADTISEIGEMKTLVAKNSKLKSMLLFDFADAPSVIRMLGNAGGSVVKSLRNAHNKQVGLIKIAKNAMENIVSDIDTKSWTGRKAELKQFNLEAGGDIALTPAQIMDLYLLSRREQAKDHLLGGGITLSNDIEKVAKGKIRDINKQNNKKREDAYDSIAALATANRLSVNDIAKIVDTLTDEQKQVADAMQKFMATTCAAWGNEITQKLYGYDGYTERDYVPIVSCSDFIRSMDSNAPDNVSYYAVANQGFTKATVKHANNPIVVGDLFEVFADHINNMILYNAYTIPLSDAMKWINFKTEETSIKNELRKTYGDGAEQWLLNLFKDLNGVKSKAYSDDSMGRLVSRSKGAKVAFNARVAIQQPTAFLKASLYLDEKYMVKAAATSFVKGRQGMQRAKEHCPIALWKSWGFFDTNIGPSMTDLLLNRETGLQKLEEFGMKGAELGDAWTWGVLWNACEYYVQDTRSDLEEGSAEYYSAVSDKLTEIIDNTQVVDSPFHRTQIMRSKGMYAKLVTAFMAEPMKSYNMLKNAALDVIQGKQGAKKFALKTAYVYAITQIAVSAAAALVDGFRKDDDEDDEKNWWQRYWKRVGEAFKGNLLGDNFLNPEAKWWQRYVLSGNLSPLGLLPFAKDWLSVIDGYDVSRMDMDVASDLINAFKTFDSDKATPYQKAYQATKLLSDATGLPISNATRTFKSVYNIFSKEQMGKQYTDKERYKQLYDYKVSGDKKNYDRVYAIMQKNGKDYDSIMGGIKTAYAENDTRVAMGAIAYVSGDMDGYIDYLNQIANDYDEEFAKKVIGSYANWLKSAKYAFDDKDEEGYADYLEKALASGVEQNTVEQAIKGIESKSNSDSDEAKMLYKWTDIYAALDSGQSSAYEQMYQDALNVKVTNGKFETDAKEEIKKKLQGYYKQDYIDEPSKRFSIESKLNKTGLFSQSDYDDWVAQSFNGTESMKKAFEGGLNSTRQYVNDRVSAKVKTGMAEDSAKYGIRTSISNAYKQEFINGDANTRARIITYMTNTGVYGSRQDVIAYINKNWLK